MNEPPVKYIRKSTLNPSIINEINEIKIQNPQHNILVEIPNTRGISSELLGTLDKNIYIRIAGAYDNEFISKRRNYRYKSGETINSLFNAVIYTRDEAIKIVSEMEKIEKNFAYQNVNEIEKLTYIYDKLKFGIMYDPKFEEKGSNETRSLRGLLTKKTVCAGYAIILKELLDRQGIECHYVSGKAIESGKIGGHAWNIVTINGKNYPIDLTWDNAKFRIGKFGTFNFFGQNVEKFKETHIPADNDPCKDYVLSEIDFQLVIDSHSMFLNERTFDSTIYYASRSDSSLYMLAQLDCNEIENKSYYIYYYSDLSNDGKLSNPSILYSETNVASLINSLQWHEPLTPEYKDAIINILFSKENINDSLKKGTCYIGKIEEKDPPIKSVSDISKPKDIQELFQYPTKTYQRDDGSSFTVLKMKNEECINNISLIQYYVFEVIKENDNNVLRGNLVFSERDFLQDDRAGIANVYLSRKRLDRKSKETAGYIGYYNEQGIKVCNSDLVNYFKTTYKIKQAPQKESSLSEMSRD